MWCIHYAVKINEPVKQCKGFYLIVFASHCCSISIRVCPRSPVNSGGVSLRESLVWFTLHGAPQTGVLRLMAVLVVSCPCAFGIAEPLVLTLAVDRTTVRGRLEGKAGGQDRASS